RFHTRHSFPHPLTVLLLTQLSLLLHPSVYSLFNHTATPAIYTLSLHDALPILSAADLPPSPTKSSNLSETAEVPACNVPSRSPLPALAIAPETKLGTASSGLGTLEP